MKIGIIGPFPPPRGGVSVHAFRLAEALGDQGVVVKKFNSNYGSHNGGRFRGKLTRLLWLWQFSVCAKLDVFHIHVSEWLDRAVIIFWARRRKVKTVVTFHSLRDEFDKMTFWQKQYVSYVLKNADHLIAVGDNEKNKLLRRSNCEERLSVLHAYIPPKRNNLEIPAQITDFIRHHEFVISANGSNMGFYQGQDIYGLDMLVELCGRLRSVINVGFIYCLTRLTDEEYLARIRSRIAELKIEDSFLIVLESIEFWPVLEKSHIFIRPTCTDSYGVSVAEALALGIPSVTSDVCKRPEGATLFRCRDIDDLYAKVWGIIGNYEQSKAELRHLDLETCVPAIQSIYHKLIES